MKLAHVSLLQRTRYYLADRAVPLWKKLLGLGAVAYVVMPFDAIPDFIPIFGWLDDIGVLGVVAWYLARQIKNHPLPPPSSSLEQR